MKTHVRKWHMLSQDFEVKVNVPYDERIRFTVYIPHLPCLLSTCQINCIFADFDYNLKITVLLANLHFHDFPLQF